ncbi:hypothetical protein BaRGS_00007938, partial [Batillaria attramentaria]
MARTQRSGGGRADIAEWPSFGDVLSIPDARAASDNTVPHPDCTDPITQAKPSQRLGASAQRPASKRKAVIVSSTLSRLINHIHTVGRRAPSVTPPLPDIVSLISLICSSRLLATQRHLGRGGTVFGQTTRKER